MGLVEIIQAALSCENENFIIIASSKVNEKYLTEVLSMLAQI